MRSSFKVTQERAAAERIVAGNGGCRQHKALAGLS